jgi:hypothetical protein
MLNACAGAHSAWPARASQSRDVHHRQKKDPAKGAEIEIGSLRPGHEASFIEFDKDQRWTFATTPKRYRPSRERQSVAGRNSDARGLEPPLAFRPAGAARAFPPCMRTRFVQARGVSPDRRVNELLGIGQVLNRPWGIPGRPGRDGVPANQPDELADFVQGGGRIEDHDGTSCSPFVRQEYQADSRFGSNLGLWISSEGQTGQAIESKRITPQTYSINPDVSRP